MEEIHISAFIHSDTWVEKWSNRISYIGWRNQQKREGINLKIGFCLMEDGASIELLGNIQIVYKGGNRLLKLDNASLTRLRFLTFHSSSAPLVVVFIRKHCSAVKNMDEKRLVYWFQSNQF